MTNHMTNHDWSHDQSRLITWPITTGHMTDHMILELTELHACTTSMRCGLKDSTYCSSSRSSLASMETRAILRAESYTHTQTYTQTCTGTNYHSRHSTKQKSVTGRVPCIAFQLTKTPHVWKQSNSQNSESAQQTTGKNIVSFHSQELAYELLQGTHMGRVEGKGRGEKRVRVHFEGVRIIVG